MEPVETEKSAPDIICSKTPRLDIITKKRAFSWNKRQQVRSELYLYFHIMIEISTHAFPEFKQSTQIKIQQK